MHIKNTIIMTGLIGLLSASVLMVGCAQNKSQAELKETVTQADLVKGEGTGIIADIGILAASSFEFDSAELTDAGKAAIEAYREKLGPELTDAFKVIIVGHTDTTGDESYNMALSLRRARSVADYLIATGVNADKIRAIGRGPKDPIASNDTREGRMQNRRVDVLVIAEVRALDTLEFPSAALFERDSADLDDEGKSFLDKNILTAKELMSRASFIEIIGHTDDKWEADYNIELSEKRAATVRDYLVSQGVDESKIVTTGMGEAMPIASNATRAGRAANRRVQILVLGRTK
ncbi:MAG: OmpA family protein [Gammaproteobacteria bacterium]|jgi:outer membrane protein OmpA-like peptidoglycan-associated protein